MKDFIIAFSLPSDECLFIRHYTNVCAKNKKEAISYFRHCMPIAENVEAELGLVMTYGQPWVDKVVGIPTYLQDKWKIKERTILG